MSFSGVRSLQALSLLEFPEEEFVKHSLRGLARILCHGNDTRLKGAVQTRKLFKIHGQTESALAHSLYRMYQQEGIDKVESLLSACLEEHCIPLRARYSQLKGAAGYLVRATRAPFRLPCGKTHCVSLSDLEEAAYEGGRLYAALLRKGVLHHVPSAGNITIAGELMDFEDTSGVAEHGEIRKNWAFMAKQFIPQKEKVGTLEEYLVLTLGKRFLENFCPFFLQGAGIGSTPEKAAKSIIEMHRRAFGELVNKRYPFTHTCYTTNCRRKI